MPSKVAKSMTPAFCPKLMTKSVEHTFLLTIHIISPLKDTGFTVTNVQTRGGYIFFFGVSEGTLRVGDELNQQFDEVNP